MSTYQCCPSCVDGHACEKSPSRITVTGPASLPWAAIPPLPDLDVMSVDEGAAFLRVHRDTLYDAIGRGEVPHRRIGRKIRLSRAVLMRWLEGDASI